MSETREKLTAKTSARDPIDRWLDVFVRLLRVPGADAERIRDELEDHLRARVDDLMVTGLGEPEAVRAAVAELGETADLAKQFQSAVHSRRRPVMQTLLVAAAGAAVALGSFAVLGPSGRAPGAAPATTGQADVSTAVPADSLHDSSGTEPVVFARNLEPAEGEPPTLGALLELLEETTGRQVIVPQTGLGRLHQGVQITSVELEGLTIRQGLDLIGIDIGGRPSDPFVLNDAGAVDELATQSYFDRRDAVLVEYDIGGLLYPPAGSHIVPAYFAETVADLIEPGLWTSRVQGQPPRARMGVLSTTMLVNAHPRVHEQIEGLFARIEARYERQRADQKTQNTKNMIERLASERSQLEANRRTLREIEQSIGEARNRLRSVRSRTFRHEHELEAAAGSGDIEPRELIKLRVDLAESNDQIQALLAEIDELETRRGVLAPQVLVNEATVRSLSAELGDPGADREGSEAGG